MTSWLCSSATLGWAPAAWRMPRTPVHICTAGPSRCKQHTSKKGHVCQRLQGRRGLRMCRAARLTLGSWRSGQGCVRCRGWVPTRSGTVGLHPQESGSAHSTGTLSCTGECGGQLQPGWGITSTQRKGKCLGSRGMSECWGEQKGQTASCSLPKNLTSKEQQLRLTVLSCCGWWRRAGRHFPGHSPSLGARGASSADFPLMNSRTASACCWKL